MGASTGEGTSRIGVWLIAIAAAGLALGCASAPQRVPAPLRPPIDVSPQCRAFVVPHDPDTRPPRALRHDAPLVPETSRQPGARGYACVAATVDARGRVVATKILATNDQEFALRVTAAMRGWRFEPATKDGAPVEYRDVYSAGYAVADD
jgi:outer membrane biosynthesis protein TonB